jgi:hypothetical protein
MSLQLMKNEITRKSIVNQLAAALMLSITLGATDMASADDKSGGTEKPSEPEMSSPQRVIEGREKAQESVNALSLEIQDLKHSVIALNKDLRVLQEELLFPANTQVTVFLSMDVGKFFTLDSVKLKIDGKVVASHAYSDKELLALSRGGTHRLHMTNLSKGEHMISAFFIGQGPNGREYKLGTSMKVEKSSGHQYVELKIIDSTEKLQPEMSIAQW